MPDPTRRRQSANPRIAALLVAIAFVGAACGGSATVGTSATSSTAATSTTSVAGEPAPTRSFALFDGSAASLADYAGKPVVLNFWASWCPSCVAEMAAAFRPVAERLGDEVTFVGMNIQDDRSLADALLVETGVEWTNALDPDGDLYLDLGGLGMPFTVFIDGAGNVIDEHNGPLNEAQLTERISALFGIDT